MPIFEYFCNDCQKKFEELSSSKPSENGKCPKCKGKNTQKLISTFKTKERGDLRESTLHGCHDVDVEGPNHEHHHDHDHDHDHDD